MKKSQFESLIREVIRETIRKVDGKYVVYPEKGGKRLGTHSTKSAAEKQLTAIHLNKEAVEPNFDFEWGEATRYPEFEKLGKDKWIELAKTGKAIEITSAEDINNTDANEPNAFKTLDPSKQKRALAQLKSGNVEMPIVALYSDGYKELVAGNTRLTAMIAQDGKATIWQFKVPDEIEENSANDTDIFKFQITDKVHDEGDNSLITVEYKFNTLKDTYRVEFYSGEYDSEAKIFDLAFGLDREGSYKLDTFQMTGKGQVKKILQTLTAIIQDFLTKFDVEKVNIFPTDEKRRRVYKAVIGGISKVEIHENYADGKVAEVKQEATDSMAVIFDRNEYDLFLYDITAKQILGYINVYNNTVTGVAAKKGYGPLMYELGMAHVYPNALQSDRNGNTEPEAKAVWEKFIAGANPKIKVVKLSPSDKEYRTKYPNGNEIWDSDQFYNYKFYNPDTSTLRKLIINGNFLSLKEKDEIIKLGNDFYHSLVSEFSKVKENYADGKVKGKSRPGRVKRAGASCKGSVTDLRAKAKKYSGEKGKMYRWCLNMKAGRQK